MHLTDRGDERDNLHAVRLLQVLFRKCARGHAADGLARTAAPATAARFHAVLLQVGVVGVARAGEVVERIVRVVVRALVLVAHHHRDRRTERDVALGAGEDLDLVLFVALDECVHVPAS